MIPQVRQITSSPLTHRASTLQSISAKTRDVTARIVFLQVEGERMRDAMKQAPDDTSSRLQWLNTQLQSN